jgi:hypothetical protein
MLAHGGGGGQPSEGKMPPAAAAAGAGIAAAPGALGSGDAAGNPCTEDDPRDRRSPGPTWVQGFDFGRIPAYISRL